MWPRGLDEATVLIPSGRVGGKGGREGSKVGGRKREERNVRKRGGSGERDGGRENGKGERSGDGEGGKREGRKSEGKGGKTGRREVRETRETEKGRNREREGRGRRDYRQTVKTQETEDHSTCSKADGYYGPPVLVKFHEGLIIAQVMHHNVATLQPDSYHIYCGGLGEHQYG